eukprot:458418-Prymnesium_polylepis.1
MRRGFQSSYDEHQWSYYHRGSRSADPMLIIIAIHVTTQGLAGETAVSTNSPLCSAAARRDSSASNERAPPQRRLHS